MKNSLQNKTNYSMNGFGEKRGISLQVADTVIFTTA